MADPLAAASILYVQALMLGLQQNVEFRAGRVAPSHRPHQQLDLAQASAGGALHCQHLLVSQLFANLWRRGFRRI